MKKIITRTVLLAAAVLALTGCNSKNHFSIFPPNVMIYQDYYDSEVPEYFAYVSIQSYYPIETASVTIGSTPVVMSRVNADKINAFEGSTLPTPTPSSLEGTYVFTASGTADEGLESDQIQGIVKLNENQMAKINTVSFKYEKPQIEAVIEDIDNATHYGFYFVFNDSNIMGFDRYVDFNKNDLRKGSDGNYVIQMNPNSHFGFSDFVENNKIKVYVMAKGSDGVILRSISRTIEKGAESFTEGNYPAE